MEWLSSCMSNSVLIDGPHSDCVLQHAGINACVGVRELVEARGLLATMRGLGMPPDLRAYNMLLKGASRGGYLPALDDLMESLRSEVLPSVSCHNPGRCI